MEFLLRWWDELDDTIDTSRQLLGFALDEVRSLLSPLASAFLALLLSGIRPD